MLQPNKITLKICEDKKHQSNTNKLNFYVNEKFLHLNIFNTRRSHDPGF